MFIILFFCLFYIWKVYGFIKKWVNFLKVKCWLFDPFKRYFTGCADKCRFKKKVYVFEVLRFYKRKRVYKYLVNHYILQLTVTPKFLDLYRSLDTNLPLMLCNMWINLTQYYNILNHNITWWIFNLISDFYVKPI